MHYQTSSVIIFIVSDCSEFRAINISVARVVVSTTYTPRSLASAVLAAPLRLEEAARFDSASVRCTRPRRRRPALNVFCFLKHRQAKSSNPKDLTPIIKGQQPSGPQVPARDISLKLFRFRNISLHNTMRPKKRGTPRPTRNRDTPPHPPATVPRTYAAVATIAGREEHSPTTIAAHAAESTSDDDWVKRTPAAALILPPPLQFADEDPSMTSPCQDSAAIPHLVAPRLPNWPVHLKTIVETLGYTPDVRAYMAGILITPKTTEEFQTVERCLIEAAAGDSAISWHRSSEDLRSLLKKKWRPYKASDKTQAHRGDHARQPATAAPREDAPLPDDTPAATARPDAPIPVATISLDAPIPAATNTLDALVPAATTTLDAPIPVATIILDTSIPDATTPLDAHTPSTTKSAHHRDRRRRRKRAPRPPRKEAPWKDPDPANGLDNMVQAIVKILTTGMAAYLHEKGAMPAYLKQYPRVHTQVWRTRAGERPAQTTSPGN